MTEILASLMGRRKGSLKQDVSPPHPPAPSPVTNQVYDKFEREIDGFTLLGETSREQMAMLQSQVNGDYETLFSFLHLQSSPSMDSSKIAPAPRPKRPAPAIPQNVPVASHQVQHLPFQMDQNFTMISHVPFRLGVDPCNGKEVDDVMKNFRILMDRLKPSDLLTYNYDFSMEKQVVKEAESARSQNKIRI